MFNVENVYIWKLQNVEKNKIVHHQIYIYYLHISAYGFVDGMDM